MTSAATGVLKSAARAIRPYRARVAGPTWPPAIVWIPAVIVAVSMVLPLVYLFMRTLGAGGEAWELLFRSRVAETLVNTILLAAAVTAGSVILAVPLAWLTVRTDLPYRRVWAVLTALPLVIPSYVGGFVVIAALGPHGLLQQSVAGPLGVDRLPDIYGFPGALLVLVLLSYPYVLLSVRGAMWGLDPSLEESSRSLGHNSWSTFKEVILPQLRPAIIAGALLVCLYTLSDFGAVSLLQFETFTYFIYLQFEVYGARSLAAASSLVLIGLALSILLLEARTRGRSVYHRSTVGTPRPFTPTHLGRWKWPALVFCGLVVLFALVMPLAVLTYWLGRGLSEGQSLGLEWKTVFNSVYVSVLAAVGAAFAAIPVAILAVRYKSWVTGLLERTTYVGFALPGIVIAIALVFFGANFLTPLYQTVGILIFAYVVLFLPAAVGATRASLLQVSPRLEQAARGLGKGPRQAFTSVTFPLMRPGMLAGASLVFLITMKELPATLILSPLGFDTLATSIWSSRESVYLTQAATAALVLVAASSVPMAFLLFRQGRLTR